MHNHRIELSGITPKIGRAAVWGIIVAAALTACNLRPQPGPAPQVSATPDGQTPAAQPSPTPFKAELVVCTRAEPDALIGSASPAGNSIEALVTGQAVTFGADYQAQPGLLASLPNEADGSLKKNEDDTISVTLHYRDGLKWSDGEPFTAADAVLGFQAPPVPGAPVDEVVDAQTGAGLTVQVTLAEGAEYPYVPSQPPLPSRKLAGLDPAKLAANPYAQAVNPSLGAYFVSEWAADHITLQANPNAIQPPAIPVIRIGFISDPNQLVGALGNGTCDVALDDALGIDQVAALDQAAGSNAIREYKFAGPTRDELVFNTDATGNHIPYFAEAAVRQAMAYGFDRAQAVQAMYGGIAQPADGWIAAGHWAAGGTGFGAYNFDAAKAGSLLDQAGWQDSNGDGVREYHGSGGDLGCQRGAWTIAENTPLTPTLILASNDPRRVAFAQQLRAQLKAIGIGLQLQAGDAATVFAPNGPIQHRDFDLALISLAVGPDPGGISQWVGADVFRQPIDKSLVHRWQLEKRWLETDQLVERLALSNIPSTDNDWQGQNYAGWCNEQADLAAVQANLSFDLNARKTQYAQLETLIAGDAPVIPLGYRPRIAASKNYVCGIQPMPFEPLTWNAATWHFDPQGACAQ